MLRNKSMYDFLRFRLFCSYLQWQKHIHICQSPSLFVTFYVAIVLFNVRFNVRNANLRYLSYPCLVYPGQIQL